MKDNLFEMLLNLFETSLTQLQKSHQAANKGSSESIVDEIHPTDDYTLHIKSASMSSTRVFTYEEQMKLTKASYQFLMRMKLWNVIDAEVLEIIINQLQFSESRIVTLQETKWTIRNVLAPILAEKQLTFLDLVLYQTEDEFKSH